jgi:SAM-dependent methyltransferase
VIGFGGSGCSQPAPSAGAPPGRTIQLELRGAEALQRAHYDRLAPSYEAHYSDEWSELYRRRFIYDRLTDGVDWASLEVLDAMSGSGQTAADLASRGAQVKGLDISPQLVTRFQRQLPEAVAVQGSILESGLPDASFDAVFVTSGLHHVQPHVDQAIDEIHRLLKPGGHFCFWEPHAGSLPNLARRMWYRFDPLFEANEAAVDVEHLERRNHHRFDFEYRRFYGGPAFLLVYNSLVFRVPPRLKRLYSPMLLRLEGLVEKVQGKRLSCVVAARWRKKLG